MSREATSSFPTPDAKCKGVMPQSLLRYSNFIESLSEGIRVSLVLKRSNIDPFSCKVVMAQLTDSFQHDWI